jgi:RimJ/RimL family protein N-acetyltransferase
MATLEVTPFLCRADYEGMLDYFLLADEAFLRGMGVDPKKLPDRQAWLDRLLPDLVRPDREKQTFYLGWDYDGIRVGHSNINKIIYGDHAYVHLHLWKPTVRHSGLGTELFKRSVNTFLSRFALRALYCEPYADNPAPNRVLVKTGFRFIARYRTTPGVINFEQEVNRYGIDAQMSES